MQFVLFLGIKPLNIHFKSFKIYINTDTDVNQNH